MQSSSSSFTLSKPGMGTSTPPANQPEMPVLTSYFPPQKPMSTMSKIRWATRPTTRAGRPGHWHVHRSFHFSQIIREPMAEFFGVAVFVILGTGVDCSVVLSTNKGVASSPKGVSPGIGPFRSCWILRFNRIVARISSLLILVGPSVCLWYMNEKRTQRLIDSVCTGLALGAWISGGISGGHLNPAVRALTVPSRYSKCLSCYHLGYSCIGYMARLLLAQSTWYVNNSMTPKYYLPHYSQKAFIFAQLMGGVVGAAIVYGNYKNAIDIFEEGSGIRTRATAGLFATYAVSLKVKSYQRKFEF